MFWSFEKKFWKNMKMFGKVLKKEIEAINGGEKYWIWERLKKIWVESNDNLPLNNTIKLRLLTIIIRSVFSEDGKFYPQLFLDDALYEL